MVVEDESKSARLIQAVLQSFEYDVSAIVSSGEAAIEKAEKNKPDLVLMDITLKGEMDGIEAAEQIHFRFNIPVVYLTGHTDDKLLERGRITEPFGYIVKPFNQRELKSVIEMAIYKAKMESKLRGLAAELERSNQMLQVSKEGFHNIVAKSADGILVVNKDGIICFVNPAAESLFNRKKEEIMGELFGFPVVAGDTMEIDLVRKDEKAGIGELRVVETEWKGENAYLASIRDITERKEVDKLKDEFISTVSHELRTPLTSIKNSVDLILKRKTGEISDAQEKFLLMAERNIKSLSTLIEDLLNLSKIESGKMELHERFVNMTELIKNIVSEFEYLTQKKEISLKYEFSHEEIEVFIDADKIRQVLVNLISNALKFTPRGGWIKVVCKDKGKEVLICVQDSGVGIAKKNIPKLFDRFTQFGRKNGSGAKGTGLGLAISKGIVELHKGRIWAESKLNKGSKFYFSLCRSDAEEIFREHLSGEIKKAREEESHFSVVMFAIINFKELIRQSPETTKEFLKELEEFINISLRRRADMVVKCIGEILLILPYTKKDGAMPVLERLKDRYEVFCSSREELKGKVKLVTGLVSYPEDGKDEGELLNRVRKAMNSI